ncbi:MAG: four helix bundle protein [Candidatus Falkowbacteria bacterium]
MAKTFNSLSLSLSNSPSILQRIKEGYLIWINIVPHIPKCARYTIGTRIENKFLDLLELAYIAYFTERERKVEKIAKCILALDTLKFLMNIAWEAKFISNKQYEKIALKLDETGKMFGGWKNSLKNPEKKNRDL